MKHSMQSHPRTLISTAYRDGPLYDYWASNQPRTPFRLGGKRLVSPGLRFIKQNVPEVEILEMPTAEEYRRALARGWDNVGISFYLDETRRALEMADEARRAGAAQVWGGNYGVLTPEVVPHFDRVFLGYAEQEIAQTLGQKLDRLAHPPILTPFGMPFWKIVRFGALYTTRGCCFGCTFCQTPAFAPKPAAVPLESIERVIKCYAEHGVIDLLIPDENFGILPGHANAVAELLARHGMLWTVMTRIDYLLQHFDQWRNQGLVGVMIGIESLAQEGLNALNKRSDLEKLYEAVELCRRHGIVTIGFYIIGLESDTEESIRASVLKLAAMRFDLVQVCVLTPLPQTPLWQRIEECYGIDDKDYSHFNGKHLVWRHPTLSKEKVESLMDWSFKTLYPGTNFARTLVKHAGAHARRVGRFRALPYLAANTLKLNVQPFRQLPFLPNEP
jgi:radical SAM superfamily enzyme YgiQ (UPF0313 family)